ncbi:MAG: RluA family pseudouridine synthase [Bacteroidota bacterium]|nr:RluA family pseudouridine synthase [Bacteroidota bacterium]
MSEAIKSNHHNLQVLFEDNHLIIVNKRVGDIVQADKTQDMPLSEVVKQYIKIKYNKPGEVFLGVVHRLDRPTSGIVVFARTSKALTRLNQMFKEHQLQKVYWALVKQKPEPDSQILEHYLVRNPKNNTSRAYQKEVPNSKKARLRYTVLKNLKNYHLIEIELFTGRHHQIRSQLSYIGSPIKGDLKYGDKRSNPNGGINLHARTLEFVHPVSKETIKITAPLPQENTWDKI